MTHLHGDKNRFGLKLNRNFCIGLLYPILAKNLTLLCCGNVDYSSKWHLARTTCMSSLHMGTTINAIIFGISLQGAYEFFAKTKNVYRQSPC